MSVPKALADTREFVRESLRQKLGKLTQLKIEHENEAKNRRTQAETHRRHVQQNEEAAEMADSKAREVEVEIQAFRAELSSQYDSRFYDKAESASPPLTATDTFLQRDS